MQLALPNAPGCPEAGAVNRCRRHLAAVLWCRRSPRHQLPEVLGCKQGRSSRCRGQAQGQGSLVAAGRHGQRCWGLVLKGRSDISKACGDAAGACTPPMPGDGCQLAP